MKSFFSMLKTMTAVSLALFLTVPTVNAVHAEDETEMPEVTEEVTVVTEPEEISENTHEEKSEEIIIDESDENPEEIIPEEAPADETADPQVAADTEETAETEEKEGSKAEKADDIDAEAAIIMGTIADNAVEITPGASTSVTISTPGQYKYFKYRPAAAGVYVFRGMPEDNSDTYGYWYDSMESIVKSDDDSGGNGSFLILCELNANVQYYFGTRYYNQTSRTGSYSVILMQLSEGWNSISGVNANIVYVRSGALVRNQITTIDGSLYKFDDEGYLVTNSSATYNGKDYLIDENGHFVEIKNGWNQVGDQWYYYSDGELVKDKVMKIGNAYYGFAYDGHMYSDTQFYISVYENGYNWIRDDYYRAHANGALYVNEWYQDPYYNGSWYYYGAAGAAPKGITTVNGKQYLFDYTGRLMIHKVYYTDDAYYAGDDNGYPVKLEKEGWNKAGSKWFYIKNGDPVTYRVLNISGTYYGFDDDGCMYTDTLFSTSVYDDDNNYIGHFYFQAQASGALYRNAWVKNGEDWYYFGPDARALSGVQTINGKTYVFSPTGWMYKNRTYTEGSDHYIIDNDGIATKLEEGWNSAGGHYYYVSGGNMLTFTVRKIGSAWYGFDYDGTMYENTGFQMNGSYYFAKPGGALYVSSWRGNYYYGADGKAVSGAQTINGTQYFFNYEGEAVSNRYVLYQGKLYYTNAKCVPSVVTAEGLYHEIMDGEDGYDFAGGVYVTGGQILKSSWRKINNYWYYFGSQGLYYTGLNEVNGSRYYFNNDGTMCGSGWQVTFNGNYVYANADGSLWTGRSLIGYRYYLFDNTGVMLTGVIDIGPGYELFADDGHLIMAVNTGWNNKEGTYYYFDGTYVYRSGIYLINGDNYYFDDNYKMVTDRIVNDYVFGSDGRAIKSGWYQIGANWYYVDSSTGRRVANRMITVSGKKYCFDWNGVMRTGTFEYNGTVYTTDTSGIITSQESLKNGWILADGQYLYYQNGSPYTGWLNGTYYISYGTMRRNSVVEGYWVGNDGKYYSGSGWINTGSSYYYGSEWLYASSGGKLVNGWQKIGNDWYYFSGYYMMTEPLKENGKIYYFDSNGKLAKTVTDVSKDQWVNTGSYWGYIRNGEPLYYGRYNIDGKEYSFSNGQMVTDTLYYYYDMHGDVVYYVQSNGVAASYTGWQKIQGRWYYYNQSGKSYVYGWFNDGGKTYYLDYDGMVTGWCVVNGRLFNFGSDGALKEEGTVENGWVSKGGNWYYFDNGCAVTGDVKKINGQVYGFDYDGRLGKNTLISTGELYYVDANGIIVRNTWKQVYDAWYYFGADGKALSGVQKINGKVYYFRGYSLE